MKKYISFCFFLLLAFTATSQSKVKQTRLTLKNGSELRGQLIAQDPKLKLQTQDGSVWIFAQEEIASIEQVLNPDLHKRKGFINMTELGILSGANAVDAFQPRRYSSMSFRTFDGYQFAPAFALGLTLGTDWYDQAILAPIALGIRGDLFRNRITPFYALDLGYATTWFAEQNEQTSTKGGFAFALGLGIKIKMPSQTAMLLSLGYHHQELEVLNQWWGWQSRLEKTTLNRMSLRVGFGF